MSRCPRCEKNARAAAAEARASGELEGKPDRNGRVVHFSEEERARRSELAKKLHAEGRLGGAAIGARGGQAIKRHRITDAVLDYFRQEDKQALVVKAYESALKGKNRNLRVVAANALLTREEKQDERMARDRGGAADPAGMTEEQLKEFVAQGLEAMVSRGEISLDGLAGIIDIPDSSVEEIS